VDQSSVTNYITYGSLENTTAIAFFNQYLYVLTLQRTQPVASASTYYTIYVYSPTITGVTLLTTLVVNPPSSATLWNAYTCVCNGYLMVAYTANASSYNVVTSASVILDVFTLSQVTPVRIASYNLTPQSNTQINSIRTDGNYIYVNLQTATSYTIVVYYVNSTSGALTLVSQLSNLSANGLSYLTNQLNGFWVENNELVTVGIPTTGSTVLIDYLTAQPPNVQLSDTIVNGQLTINTSGQALTVQNGLNRDFFVVDTDRNEVDLYGNMVIQTLPNNPIPLLQLNYGAGRPQVQFYNTYLPNAGYGAALYNCDIIPTGSVNIGESWAYWTNGYFTNLYSINPPLAPSQRDLKTNIRPLSHGLDLINKLPVYEYEYNSSVIQGATGSHFGWMYEDIINQGFTGSNIYQEPQSENDFGKISALQFVPIHHKAIQELSSEVRELREKIKILETRHHSFD
jgi:hypothetical protein